MNADDYQKLCTSTANTLDDKGMLIMNWMLGICGEAGEVAELVKKFTFHGKEYDRGKLVDELGDLMWYIAIWNIWATRFATCKTSPMLATCWTPAKTASSKKRGSCRPAQCKSSKASKRGAESASA